MTRRAVGTTNEGPAVQATGLVKRFGKTEALCGVDIAVERATVLGVLGPNGAGKTTAGADPVHAPEAGCGHRVHRRHRRGEGSAAGAGADRPHRSVRRGRRAAHRRTRTWSTSGGCSTAPTTRRASAPAELLERFELVLRRRSDGEDLLGRNAASSRHRDEPHRQPVGALPRRAHDRARSAQPQHHVGSHRRARAQRRHHLAHDAVPRRGRSPRRRDRGRSTTAW